MQSWYHLLLAVLAGTTGNGMYCMLVLCTFCILVLLVGGGTFIPMLVPMRRDRDVQCSVLVVALQGGDGSLIPTKV